MREVSVHEIAMQDEWESWQALGLDTHSKIADPRFVDPDHADFRLQGDSPAFALGFQPIPVDKIGPYQDDLRASLAHRRGRGRPRAPGHAAPLRPGSVFPRNAMGERQMRSGILLVVSAALAFVPCACGRGDGNLLADPSFEVTKSEDQFGLVFAKWGGWKYEGDCEFRVGHVAHTGQALVPAQAAERAQDPRRPECRTRARALPRHGLSARPRHRHGHVEPDDGVHVRRQVHAAQQERHVRLDQLTYVGEVKEKKQAGPSFGLMAPGYFWIDDVVAREGGRRRAAHRRAGARARRKPPSRRPADLGHAPFAVRECGYRNMPE